MTILRSYSTLLVERAGDVLTITFNRRERLNALNRAIDYRAGSNWQVADTQTM